MTASTTNYLWSVADVLGQGATASVYKARNKRTGEQVAVKVFNMMSYSRPYEVQIREFEMLRRLNHQNIVRLYAVEELHSRQKVLVMEYCSGGSLLSLLEESQNAYGLPESEFLIVLHCVVQGMNHLRENMVVHRDIKPGNIMRQVGEDGRSVYKLTDFGAARELEDDEKFVSIYGTEEYLHPDMYERAVLRKPQQKTYGVNVDLWSIGVTFYHAAAGSLPFIPYGGPRRNKPTMYKITTKKPLGAIAGIQKVEEGSIEWSYDLPQSCQLSLGLQGKLVPVLAGIMEADQERCWGFDHFFAATTDLLQCTSVHLLSLQQASAHRVYIHPHNTASALREEVASLTGVAVEEQRFLFLGHDLSLEGNMKVVSLPPTSPTQPLVLLSRKPVTQAGGPCREPETPVIPSRFEVTADYHFSKPRVRGSEEDVPPDDQHGPTAPSVGQRRNHTLTVIVGVVQQYLRTVRSLHTQRDLLLQGYYSYMMKIQRECGDAMLSVSMIKMRLQTCLGSERRLHTLSQSALVAPGSVDNSKKLHLIQEHLPTYAAGVREFQRRLEHLQVDQARHTEALSEDKSREKIEVLLDKIMAIHQQYHRDKLTGQLAYNDQQIHKFEKINLSAQIKRVKSLFKEESLQSYRKLLASAHVWNSDLLEIQSRLEDFSHFSRGLMVDLEQCEERQNKVLDRALLAVPAGPGGPEAGDGPQNTEQRMALRMQCLKQEMEMVVRELQCNNSLIEGLGAVNSAATALDPDVARPSTL